MPEFTVHVTAATYPTVSVEVEADSIEDVTQEAVDAALEELNSGTLGYDSYMAEFMVTEGGAWTYEVEA